MSTPPTIIHFVRHGIVHNPHQTFYGRLPRYHLSAEGVAVVKRIIPFFSNLPITAIYSSPLLRARQTAAILANGLNLQPIHLNRNLIEVSTPYDGHPMSELQAKQWDVYSGNQPPHELPQDVFNRATRFVDQIRMNFPGREIIAVTHADIVLFLSLWARGHEVSIENKMKVERHQIDTTFPNPASISTFSWNGSQDKPALVYFPNHS